VRFLFFLCAFGLFPFSLYPFIPVAIDYLRFSSAYITPLLPVLYYHMTLRMFLTGLYAPHWDVPFTWFLTRLFCHLLRVPPDVLTFAFYAADWVHATVTCIRGCRAGLRFSTVHTLPLFTVPQLRSELFYLGSLSSTRGFWFFLVLPSSHFVYPLCCVAFPTTFLGWGLLPGSCSATFWCDLNSRFVVVLRLRFCWGLRFFLRAGRFGCLPLYGCIPVRSISHICSSVAVLCGLRTGFCLRFAIALLPQFSCYRFTHSPAPVPIYLLRSFWLPTAVESTIYYTLLFGHYLGSLRPTLLLFFPGVQAAVIPGFAGFT
jgi:hypothetical protein